MLTRLFILSLLLIAITVFLGTASAAPTDPVNRQAGWDAPTTRTDGSLLTQAEISGYTLYCGNTQGVTAVNAMLTQPEPATATTANLTIDPALPWYCVITVTDTNSQESQYSNEVAIISPPSTPGGLRIVTVTVSVAVE